MKTLISKETAVLLFSRKYLVLFVLIQVLILISLLTGYERYRLSSDLAVQNNATLKKKVAGAESPFELSVSNQFHRSPSLISIFNSGLDNAIGRAGTGSTTVVSTQDSVYVEFPLLYMIRELDLTTIYVVIGSLAALMLTFASVSGEKESGTLKQMLCYSLPRANIIIAKIVGAFLAVLLIFIPATLIGILALMLLTSVNFSITVWVQIAILVTGYCLHLFIAVCAGVAVSALNKRNFTSLLFCLGLWVTFVIILPQASIGIANVASPVIAESEEERKLAEHGLPEYSEMILAQFDEYLQKNKTPANAIAMQEKLKIFNIVSREVHEERRKWQIRFWEAQRNKARNHYKTIQALSIISPAAVISNLAHATSLTDYQLQIDFENSLKRHAEQFSLFVEKVKSEAGIGEDRRALQPVETTFNREEQTVTISRNPDYKPFKVNMTDYPEFEIVHTQVWEKTDELFMFIVTLIAYAGISFALAYVAFLRYDVR